MLCLALSSAVAQAGTPKKKPAKKTPVAAKQESKDVVSEELKALSEKLGSAESKIDAQQLQIEHLQQLLKQSIAEIQAQNADVQKANTQSAAAEQKAAQATTQVAEVKTSVVATTEVVKATEKRFKDLESPTSLRYKGIRITPGGFFEMTGYFRSHATLSNQATPFSTIPLEAQVSGGYNTHLTEFGMTAQDSRIAIRTDADAGKTKLAGYFEMDFFGTGPTANINQTTGYMPRIRQGWARAKFGNGWTISGGQMWNLITLNRKGTDADNSNLWIPNVIEAQYSIGFDWGRFAEVRLSKKLSESTTLAFGLANPSYLNSGANSAVSGLAANGNSLYGNSLVSTCSSTLVGTTVTTTCTNTPTYSTNLAPDMIAKLTYDNPKLGHYEVKALGRFFRDRVVSTATVPGWNNTGLGAGIGAGAIVPIVAKKLDFVAQGMFGKGISRYQDAGQYDFVVRSTDHNLQMVKAISVLAGFEAHPNTRTELDLIFGDEYYGRTTYMNGSTIAGYGAPNATNTGCYYETVPTGVSSTCTGNNRNLFNGKLFGYYDLYKGPMGILRYGVEVDYVERGTWSGTGGLASGAHGLAPKGNEKTVYTTMRYIFP